jgi:hypothetical protein
MMDKMTLTAEGNYRILIRYDNRGVLSIDHFVRDELYSLHLWRYDISSHNLPKFDFEDHKHGLCTCKIIGVDEL